MIMVNNITIRDAKMSEVPEEKIPVVIRMEYNKYIKKYVALALFPYYPGTSNPNTMECYAHVGQHATVHTEHVRNCKKPTEKQQAEVDKLKKEIISIYGNIAVFCENIPKNSRKKRIQYLNR
ncbi:MAG: hypothetical protein [Caudoviricetes sp.]|nr:MAG: hypothetical protein [Caudoviricetes sp.]